MVGIACVLTSLGFVDQCVLSCQVIVCQSDEIVPFIVPVLSYFILMFVSNPSEKCHFKMEKVKQRKLLIVRT